MKLLRAPVLFAACLALCACHGKSSASKDGGAAEGPGIMSALADLVGFEGEIEMQISSATSSMGPTSLVFAIKKDKMRIEFPSLASTFSMVVIVDSGKKKAYWLTPSTKTYFEMPLSSVSSATAPGVPKATPTKTGKSDRIAGYSCDEWQTIDPVTHMRTVTCVTSGLSMISLGATPLKDLAGGSWLDSTTMGFPLRAETFDMSGASMSKWEAKRIEKKKEPDANFEVPPGYHTSASIFGYPLPDAGAPPP